MLPIVAKEQFLWCQSMTVNFNQIFIQIEFPFIQDLNTVWCGAHTMVVGQQAFLPCARYHLRIWLHRIFQSMNHKYKICSNILEKFSKSKKKITECPFVVFLTIR